MKKFLFTIVATFLFAFTSLAAGKPEMEFKVTSRDFGYIDEYGGNVSYEFEFTNTGDKPLMIYPPAPIADVPVRNFQNARLFQAERVQSR